MSYDIYENGTTAATTRNIVFIDNRIDEYSTFVDSLNTNSLPVVYDSSLDTPETILQKLSSVLLSPTDPSVSFSVGSVSFVFHGLILGSQEVEIGFIQRQPFFTRNDIDSSTASADYSSNLQFLLQLVAQYSISHIDFLGCNLLTFPEWRVYFQLFMDRGVQVGASGDNTGNLKYGGDWVMESTMEDVKQIYFTDALLNYAELLLYYNTITATQYYHEFYSYSSTNSTILNRQIYDNSGTLIYAVDISFGGMSIPNVLALLDENGTNAYTIGIVDPSANKVRMDLAYCDVFGKFISNTDKATFITNVNSSYKEPTTIADEIYNVTVSGGLFSCKTTQNVDVSSIDLSANSLYIFDQSDSSNLGNAFKLSSTQNSFTEITSGVSRNGTPGTLNAYTMVSPLSSLSAYVYNSLFFYYVKVQSNAISQPVFAISTSSSGTYYAQPNITFSAGTKYKFDVSDPSVAGFNLVFGTVDASYNETMNSSLYSAVGTPGTAGAYVMLDVASGYSGATIQYFEDSSKNMGYVGYTAPTNIIPEIYWLEFDTNDTSGTTLVNRGSSGSSYTATIPAGVDICLNSIESIEGSGSLQLNNPRSGATKVNYIQLTNMTTPISFTVSMWIKPTLNDTNQTFWQYTNGSYSTTGIYIGSQNNKWNIWVNNMQSNTIDFQINDGNWHQLVIIYNNGTTVFYIDTVLLLTITSQIISGAIGNNRIGSASWLTTAESDYALNGYMDDFRFYNRALSATEISTIYNYVKSVQYTVSVSGGSLYLRKFSGYAILNPTITFRAGFSYTFIQSDPSNANKQIVFGYTNNGATILTASNGVTVVGIPGTSGASTRLDLPGTFTGTLYYYYL
jgi:hypothetical protein